MQSSRSGVAAVSKSDKCLLSGSSHLSRRRDSTQAEAPGCQEENKVGYGEDGEGDTVNGGRKGRTERQCLSRGEGEREEEREGVKGSLFLLSWDKPGPLSVHPWQGASL